MVSGATQETEGYFQIEYLEAAINNIGRLVNFPDELAFYRFIGIAFLVIVSLPAE